MNVLKTLICLATLVGLFHSGGAQAQSLLSDQNRANSHAVTAWWVIFNDPANCYGSDHPTANCTAKDVFGAPFLASVDKGTPNPALIAPNEHAGVAVLYATGGSTGPNGKLELAAALYRSTPGTQLALPPGADPMGFGRGLESSQAEIHLVIRDHGAVSSRGFISQITNFLDPYCSDPNLLYIAGPNLCVDRQFAVFAPGESGSQPIQSFDNPAVPVVGAKAHLSRSGDVVRAVVRTRLTEL